MAEAGPAQASRIRRTQVLLPLLLLTLGTIVTLITWSQVRNDRQATISAGFMDLTEEVRSTLESRVERHLAKLRNLARFWQLHGLLPMPVWRFDTGMVIESYPGIGWIAWIPASGDSIRYVAADSLWKPSSQLVAHAIAGIENPGAAIVYPTEASREIVVHYPIRTPDLMVGTLVAGIRADSLIAPSGFATAEGLAMTVRTEDGFELFRRGTPAADAPRWLQRTARIPLTQGGGWTVHYAPTREYVERTHTQWPRYVLFVGLLLSLGLGAITFQIMRVRAYSYALARSNESLDARVRELTERDRELRRLNEELEARVELRTAELRDAMSELEAFSHSISHDLRSPVGAIVNYTSILEEDYGERLDDEGRRVLVRIQKSSESAIALLNDLVQLARAGRAEPVREPVDMTEVARRAFTEAVAGDASGIEVDFNVDPLPVANGDPALIERVFSNLFSNSLKYTRERDVRTIRVTGYNGNGLNTYLVEDNGVGFDPESAGSVFEPFTRLHSSQRFGGTGLGLAIVARIVRRLGGTVWAESDGSSGARFAFTLPVPEESR